MNSNANVPFSNTAGDEMETEYALGYGLTRRWTVKGEVPFHIEEGGYHFGGFALKQKYPLFSQFKPGLSRQISALATVHLPAESENNRVLVYNHEGKLLQILEKGIDYPADVLIVNEKLIVVNFGGRTLCVYGKAGG